jgi:hypothetical protein
LVGGGGGVEVRVGVQVGSGVGESSEDVVETDGVNGFQVGEEVGIKVGVAVGVEVAVEVEVAMLFPSASESEKPPRSKPIEARATRIPVNNCCKFFIAGSLQAAPP